MKTHLRAAREPSHGTASHKVAGSRGPGDQTTGWADIQPSTDSSAQLITMAGDSPRMRQLKRHQDAADHSAQVGLAMQRQAIARGGAREEESNVADTNAAATENIATRSAASARSRASVPVVQGVFIRQTLDKGKHVVPAREVLAAQRRLQNTGIDASAFTAMRSSPEEVDLDGYVRQAEEMHSATTSTKMVTDHPEGSLDPPAGSLIDPRYDQPVAIVTPELITAYRQDLIDDNGHFLQEAEGNAIADKLGVRATVMNQVSGPLIQSNGIQYGNGGAEGYLLHINGNHYIVIARAAGEDVDFVDMDGNGYTEVIPTVADGNCLIDGLYIIRHRRHAPPEATGELREVAEAHISDERITAIMSTILTDFAAGIEPTGIGAQTMGMMQNDSILQGLHRGSRRDRMWQVFREAKIPLKRPRKPSLEDAITTYVLECNRVGEDAMRGTEQFLQAQKLWRQARRGDALPGHTSLSKWIAKRETAKGDYYGSDTDSDTSDSEGAQEDDDRMLAEAYAFTDEDEALLERLNVEIKAAKNNKDIEVILRNKEYGRFVVPQFRGIAYMTNRFSKEKRREHRRSSQVGLPVFADAVRPETMQREIFYTTRHGFEGTAVKNAKKIQKWLAEKRLPSPIIDPNRKVTGTKKKAANRVFPTGFHVLQSDYSEDYTKSSVILAEYHAKAMGKKKEKEKKTGKKTETMTDDVDSRPSKDPARDMAYTDVPFRSHPFVSTADEARHAVRYALGNKPIAAEKGFRLRPRWRKDGKPQHPYSGKVYTSLHPLRDYLSPYAPSHVWSGRKTGSLAINNHISKEGESSFLAMLKHDRVALEQVIRWPSLTTQKDESEEFGLSAEKRQMYRTLLETTAPHSEEQKSMKSDHLGPWMEKYFVDLIDRRTRAEAVRRNQKLIYRGLDGNFQSKPPKYVTPSKQMQDKWRAPPMAENKAEMFEKIRSGKTPYGGLTEGYFADWPKEDVYDELSDDEYVHDDDNTHGVVFDALVEQLGHIRDETLGALNHLRNNNNLTVSASFRAAAIELARRAWHRMSLTAFEFGISTNDVEFPEELAQEPMAIVNADERVHAADAHIRRLVDELFVLTSTLLRIYLSAER